MCTSRKVSSGLSRLEEQARSDVAKLAYPAREWVKPVCGPQGKNSLQNKQQLPSMPNKPYIVVSLCTCASLQANACMTLLSSEEDSVAWRAPSD